MSADPGPEEAPEITGSIKLQIIGACLACIALVPGTIIRSRAFYPIDPFKRYWGQIISQKILSTGGFSGSMFPTHSELLVMANDQTHNILNYIIIAVYSEITGLSVNTIHFFPLYSAPFVLLIGVISRRLHGKDFVLIIAIPLSIGYHFPNMQWFSAAHQGYLVWFLFFLLLFFHIIIKDRNSALSRIIATSLLASLILAFTISDHTFPLSSLLFFGVFYLSCRFFSINLFSMKALALTGVIIVAVYGVVFSWFNRTVITFITIFAGETRYDVNILSVLGATTNIHPILTSYVDYLGREIHPLYRGLTIFSALSAVAIFGIAVITRFKRLWSLMRLEQGTILDALLVAFVIQLVFFAAVTPIFAYSGGIDAKTLGLFISPIFGSIIIHKWIQYSLPFSANLKTVSIILVVLLLMLMPLITVMWRGHYDATSSRNLEESSIDQLIWYIDYQNDGRVVSDLNTLSYYHTLGGRGPIYLPSSTDLDKQSVAKEMVRVYYRDPASVSRSADVFIVNNILVSQAVVHRGAARTVPSEELNQKLSKSSKWAKVYSSGQNDSTYVVT